MKQQLQNTSMRALCALLCLLVCAATLTGCLWPQPDVNPEADADAPLYTEDATLGEGKTQFTFRAVTDDVTVTFVIHTDATTVGAALMENGLIEGEAGPYGLYVKRVNNILADYDVDGSWWCFYINGEMAMSGVDMTDIDPGAEYEFRKEK